MCILFDKMTFLVLLWKTIDDIRYLSLFNIYFCELPEALNFLSSFIQEKSILNISLCITTLLQHDTQFLAYILNSVKVEFRGRKKYQGKEKKVFAINFPLDYHQTVFAPQLHLTPHGFSVAKGRVNIILVPVSQRNQLVPNICMTQTSELLSCTKLVTQNYLRLQGEKTLKDQLSIGKYFSLGRTISSKLTWT